MTGITHKQAGRYMRADLNGLLTKTQHRDLTAHLDECEACRLESESLSSLTTRLQNGFHSRWDTQHGPSTNVIANIQSQSRRIIMSKRINTGLKLFAGLTALILLGFLFNPFFKQLQEYSEKNKPVPNSTLSENGNNNTEGKPTPSSLTSSLTIQEAKALAGFDVLEPSYLPEGYTFQGATYDPKIHEVTLKYISSPEDANKMGVITIYQILGDFPKPPSPLPYMTPVPVRDVMGEFTHGAWVYDSSNITTPRWEGDNDYYALSWQKDGMSFMVDFLGGVLTPPVQLDSLTAIAESLKSATQDKDRLIVFASENKSGANRNMDIFTMHTDGSNVTNITNNLANDTSPAWSPDGQKIAFVSERTGNTDIFIMTPDGSDVTQLTDNLGYDGNVTWSLDGKKIVYVSDANDPNAESQLMIMNPDGSNKVVLTQETGSYSFMSWSPDGQKIIYQKDSTDPSQGSTDAGIFIVNIDGSNQYELFKGGGILSMRWEDTSNFSSIIYTQLDSGNWYLYRFNMEGKPAVQLGNSSTPIDGWFTEGSKTIYITKNTTTWFWHDNQRKVSQWPKWNFSSSCKDYSPKDVYQHDADHVMSPDGKHLFVIVTCNEGVSHFYLVSTDGSDIKELTNMPTPISWQALFPTWSPDGKYVILTSSVALASNESAYMDFYLFDIEKMLNDPSTKPIQLTTDKAFKFNPGWQPHP